MKPDIETVATEQIAEILAKSYWQDDYFAQAFGGRDYLTEEYITRFFQHATASLERLGQISLACVHEGKTLAAATFQATGPAETQRPKIFANINWSLQSMRLQTHGDLPFAERMNTYTELRRSIAMDESYLSVSQLGVIRQYRKKGLATLLLNHIAEMVNQSPTRVGIQVATYAQENISIYERLGFKIAAEGERGEMKCWVMIRED